MAPVSRHDELEDENLRLRRAVEELSFLNDLARAIGASSDPQEIMNTIIRRSLRALNAEQGVITLVEEQAGNAMKTLASLALLAALAVPAQLSSLVLAFSFLLMASE